jgi:multicomponent Na+:H+ antiporter subunit E
LTVALALLWLLLSGFFLPLLLALGAASVALTVWLARRMDLIDHEGVPLHIGPAIIR